jgi:Restriction Endonuclease associating with ARP
MKDIRSERKIIRHEIITDQSNPKMVEFRKSRGEYELGCKRQTVRLEITEYEPGPDGLKVTTNIGYYEGEPPPGYDAFWRQFYQKVLNEASQDQKEGRRMEKNVLSEEFQKKWAAQPLFDKNICSNIDDSVHLHTELMNVRSSAAACLNTIGNIAKDKNDLISFLNTLDLGVEDIIPFPTGTVVGGLRYADKGNVLFEWIGPNKSPLNEKGGKRGLQRTSIDAYILAKIDGKITQLLIEWKFTETYNSPQNTAKFSGIAGNERLRRYSICLAELRKRKDFPFRMDREGGFGLYDLCYEPFYQLLRMTLLAKLTTPLQLDNGLLIEDYRILHLSHTKNKAFDLISQEHLNHSPGLQHCVGKSLHDAWKTIILSKNEAKKFYCGYWDDAIKTISDGELKHYLLERYVG